MIRFNSVNPYLLTNCEGSTIAIDISARTSMIVKTVAALPGCSFADMNAKSIQITGLRSWIAGCGECLPWSHTEHHRLCGKSVSSWSSRSCLLDSFGEGSPRSRNADSDCWNVCLHRLVVKLSWRICRHSVECHLCQWRLSWRCEEGLLTSTCSHCSWYGWYYGCLWSGNESSDTFGLDSVPAMHSDLLGWRWCLIQQCLVFIPWTISRCEVHVFFCQSLLHSFSDLSLEVFALLFSLILCEINPSTWSATFSFILKADVRKPLPLLAIGYFNLCLCCVAFVLKFLLLTIW